MDNSHAPLWVAAKLLNEDVRELALKIMDNSHAPLRVAAKLLNEDVRELALKIMDNSHAPLRVAAKQLNNAQFNSNSNSNSRKNCPSYKIRKTRICRETACGFALDKTPISRSFEMESVQAVVM
jgi:hypothetical protein